MTGHFMSKSMPTLQKLQAELAAARAPEMKGTLQARQAAAAESEAEVAALRMRPVWKMEAAAAAADEHHSALDSAQRLAAEQLSTAPQAAKEAMKGPGNGQAAALQVRLLMTSLDM